jgi:hypothetical protein
MSRVTITDSFKLIEEEVVNESEALVMRAVFKRKGLKKLGTIRIDGFGNIELYKGRGLIISLGITA